MTARRQHICWGVAIAVVAGTVAGVSYRQRKPSDANLSPSIASDRRREQGRHALLVGCAEYIDPAIRSLAGPTNDVRLMKEVLIKSCGFSPDNITTLAGPADAGSAPTRANIERAFQNLRSAAQDGDQVFILLAGHGSRQPNAPDDTGDLETDGLDEIFLPIDAGQWSGGPSGSVANAIVDDEIYRWTTAIAFKGAWVSIVFDCCCAGTAVRGDYREVPRFLSPENDLGIPAPLLGDKRPSGAAEAKETPAWESAGSERIVALYACQSHETEPELPLPPGGGQGEGKPDNYGLLTYALCNVLSQPRNDELSYRDLGREVWLKYRSWGRASPTPFVEGTNLTRQVLGMSQAQTTFRVVRKTGSGWQIDGGRLHGLTTGSILAIPTPNSASQTDQTCYARVVSAEPMRARIVPCSYQGTAAVKNLPVGARCDVAFTNFGEMRTSVALDFGDLSPADAQVIEIDQTLQHLAASPAATIRIADDLASAEWVVARRRREWQLLPKSVAGFDEDDPLPLGTPSLTLDETVLASSLEARLTRIFRAQNLIRLAGSLPQPLTGSRDPLKLSVKLMSISGDSADGEVHDLLSDGVQLHPGEHVEWQMTNEGASPIDVTLLVIDSQLRMEAVFPASGDLVSGNRLSPGESRSFSGEVNADTLGSEQLIAIAVRGRGPQQDFRWLAEPTLATARQAATRGAGTTSDESPLARLLEQALYCETSSPINMVRGITSADAEDSLLVLRTWSVVPR